MYTVQSDRERVGGTSAGVSGREGFFLGEVTLGIALSEGKHVVEQTAEPNVFKE